MAIKLQKKVARRIWLQRKVTFLNNSVIYKDIELKFSIEINFEPLSLKSNIKLQFDVMTTS